VIPRHLQITFALLVIGVFAMGAYVLTLRHRVAASAVRFGDGRAMAPPVSNPAEPITLYIAFDDDGILQKRPAMAALPSEPTARAKEVLRTLLNHYVDKPSPHPIAEGSDVNEVFIVNNSLAVVDLNLAFAEGHRSGVWEEALTVDSIVATLAANMPQIKQVKILVDGHERETLAGHADLIGVYQVSDVNRLIQEMQ